ncbi:hypothetical protein P5V15_007767 [Pogonomyrmex californicus]
MMADFSRTSIATNINADSSADKTDVNEVSYWKQMLKAYERRNASLERRHSVLAERVRFMECTLPSLLMGAAASAAYGKRGAHDKQAKAPENTSKST